MSASKSAGGLGIRGLMVDPARLVERHEFYFELLPLMAEWGYNTLWWHFVDDQGFVLKLDGHPELATPFAFSKAEMRRLIEAAAAVGVDVVPEVETLGHARYITRLPRYRHLADGKPGNWMNACCPSHPDTLRLMREILEEVAELFPSAWLHAGLDEVDISHCELCAKRGRGKPSWWLYAEHTRAIHEVITGLGKRMTMWADHVEKDPDLLKALPKDIVLTHWQYSHTDPVAIRRSIGAGFDVIGAPSLFFHGTMIQPRGPAFDVMDEMTSLMAGMNRGVLGMVNTWWTPWRHLRDTPLFAVYYTGKMLAAGGGVDRRAAARDFCRTFFGLRAPAAAGEALWRLHELVPRLPEVTALLFDSPTDLAEAVVLARGEGYDGWCAAVATCIEALEAARGSVTAHAEAFEAVLEGARTTAAVLEAGRMAREAWRLYSDGVWARDHGAKAKDSAAPLTKAADVLKEIGALLTGTAKAVGADWDRTRHKSDAKRGYREASAGVCPEDSLLGRLERSAAYAKALGASLRAAGAAHRRGGAFPDLT